MEVGLQQTLKSLCFKTGWCYAVFWKLKRRSRMVLTWEDGYCEYKKPSVISSLLSTQMAPNSLPAGSCLGPGGNPLEQGVCVQEGSCLEEQISLALAKMSYQVYSLGEGIIGRVAFTGKHQWVYSDGEKNSSNESNYGSGLNSRNILEKYPDGWQNQFAAGIKTIAVIAVLQGVVQLGSMQTITEDLDWVDQIKSVFGSLQGVPGAFRADLVSEGRGGKGHTQATAIPSTGIGPSAHAGRISTLHQAHPGQKNAKFVSGGALNVLEYSLFGKMGSSNGLTSSQALAPFTKVINPTKIMVPESQLQQAFLQPSSYNNLKGTEVRSSDTGPLPLDLKPLHAFAGLLQTNISTLGNQKLSPFNTDMGRNNLKLVEQMLVEKSCLTKQQGIPSNKIVTDFQPQAHIDTPASSVQVSSAARHVADELAMRSHGSFRVSSVPEVLQQIPTSLSIEAAAGYGQSGNTSQNQPPSLTGGLRIIQPLKQNLGPDFHKPLLSPNNVSSQKSTGQVCEPSYTLHTDLPTDLSSSCLEDIVASFKSPTSQVPFCLNNLTLDQKGWDKEVLNKAPANSTSQSSIEVLGQGKGDALELESTISDLPSNVGYNSIDTKFGYNCNDTGRFDDLENYITSFTNRQDKNLTASFAIGDELSQALGPGFKKEHDKEFWEEILLQASGEQVKESYGLSRFGYSSSTNWAETEIAQSFGSSCSKDELSKGAVGGVYSTENKSELLLEAVIGASSINQTASQIIDDSFSCKATFSGFDSGLSVLNPTTKVEPTDKLFDAGTEQLFGDCMPAVFQHENIGEQQYIGLVSDSQESLSLQRSVKDSSTKAMLSSWIEGGQSVKCESMQPSQVQKPDEISKFSRKRARPGESTRPRPKDRQQIQDRVRELREIVPNGSKCSIDALLEKTIKHMRFLQSVTQHADKLKQSGELKVSKTDDSLLAQDEMESGASWALELGGQRAECPIIVENLNQPRQMRVEMLCEERGLFLEIADIIRGLGLTILKGVMESRIDKIWARFVVEANRDVHRIDILWSLMQLLQPNTKNGLSVTSQAVPKGTSSMDSGSQAFCGFQQASLMPLHLKERLH